MAISSVAVAGEESTVRTANGRPLTAAMKRQISQFSRTSGNAVTNNQYASASQDETVSARSRVQQRLMDARQSAINAARFGAAGACY